MPRISVSFLDKSTDVYFSSMKNITWEVFTNRLPLLYLKADALVVNGRLIRWPRPTYESVAETIYPETFIRLVSSQIDITLCPQQQPEYKKTLKLRLFPYPPSITFIKTQLIPKDFKLFWNFNADTLIDLLSGTQPILLTERKLGFSLMQIWIKLPISKTTKAYAVTSSDSILSVKQQIYEDYGEGLQPQYQQIEYCGKQLENHRTLADYNIQTEHTISVNIRGGDNANY